MLNFCVNNQSQLNGDHEVHNLDAGCRYLPAMGHRVPLGQHASCQSAVSAARRHYPRANGCFYCANSCHTT